MEKWKEVFAEKVPKGVYEIQMINGEKQGLVIELSNHNNKIYLRFGAVFAVRMLDEGMVQSGLYSHSEIAKFKEKNFANVIYEVEEGQFKKQINEISDGYGEILSLKHYVVITQNFNVDVVTQWEPIIEVN